MRMTDYKKMKVADLREILTTEPFGYTQEEVRGIKGKAKLIETIEEVIKNEEETDIPDLDDVIGNVIGNVIDESDDVNDGYVEKTMEEVLEDMADPNSSPQPKDPEWTDYILSDLTEDEKIKENPTTDGLRRLVEKFIGEIVESNTDVLQAPSPDNERRATVKVEIVVRTRYTDLRFSGAADVYPGNSVVPFCNHPVATAETKAEGRAYKRALKLRRVSTWEELDGSTTQPSEPTEEFPTFIKEEQINFLDVLGQRLDIDLNKFISTKHEIKDVRKLSYEQGGKLVGELSSMQNNKEEIDKDIQGYQKDWQIN